MPCMLAYVQVATDRTNVNLCPKFGVLCDLPVYSHLIVEFPDNNIGLLCQLCKSIPLARIQMHNGPLSVGRHELSPTEKTELAMQFHIKLTLTLLQRFLEN